MYPAVFAHRGASGYAPENTLAAFELAANLGCQWLEFDVMLTQCGEVVIFHDDTLLRLCGKKMLVKNLTYTELSQLPVITSHQQYQGQTIMRLHDAIVHLQRLGLSANIELKPVLGDEKLLAQKVAEIINQCWPSELPAPIFSSFNHLSLHHLQRYLSTAKIALLFHRWQKNCLQLLQEFNALALHINHHILSEKKVAMIKQHDFFIATYTVNEPLVMQKLLSWGVDGIFSDYPDRALLMWENFIKL